jgi:hypothetical protein
MRGHAFTLPCSYHHNIPGTYRIPDMCVRLSPLHRCDAPIKVHSHALVTSSADSPILMSRCRRRRCRERLVTNLALGQYCCRHVCIPDAAICCCRVVACFMLSARQRGRDARACYCSLAEPKRIRRRAVPLPKTNCPARARACSLHEANSETGRSQAARAPKTTGALAWPWCLCKEGISRHLPQIFVQGENPWRHPSGYWRSGVTERASPRHALIPLGSACLVISPTISRTRRASQQSGRCEREREREREREFRLLRAREREREREFRLLKGHATGVC